MTQDGDLKQRLTPDEYSTLQQGIEQDAVRALQEGTVGSDTTVQNPMKATYPTWPKSIPGPQVTQPPPGMRTIGLTRSEQNMEVGYDAETGTPSTEDAAFDPLDSTQPAAGPRRKKDRIE